jgi:6-hydroxytryprostatin B O-methyltransferase
VIAGRRKIGIDNEDFQECESSSSSSFPPRMATSAPTLTELAAQISTLTKQLSDSLSTHSLPPPSFAADAPPSLPRLPEYADIQVVRTSLIAAAGTLCDLAMGPDEVIITKVFLVSVFFSGWRATFTYNSQHTLQKLTAVTLP